MIPALEDTVRFLAAALSHVGPPPGLRDPLGPPSWEVRGLWERDVLREAWRRLCADREEPAGWERSISDAILLPVGSLRARLPNGSFRVRPGVPLKSQWQDLVVWAYGTDHSPRGRS